MDMAEAARNSLPIYSELMSKVNNWMPNNWHHNEWYKYLGDEDLERLMLVAPRNHSKTECSIMALTWMIGRNPNIRIMLVSKAFDQAAATLRKIGVLMGTPTYQSIFKGITPNEDRWNRMELEVTRDTVDRNPTVFAAGLTGTIVSRRCDVLFIDDPVDDEITNSETKNQRAKDYYESVLTPCLEPNGRVIILLTRWGYNDFASYIMDKKEFNKGLHVYKALNKDSNNKWQSLWPERWPVKKLLQRKEGMGSYHFNMQFQNDPRDPETAPFKREDIKYVEILPASLKYYMAIDPAATSTPRADYTVIVVLGVNSGTMYVVDVFRKKIDFPDQVKALRDYNAKYKPYKIGVETGNYQNALYVSTKQLALPVVEVKHGRQSKDARIVSMTPFIHNGSLMFNRSYPSIVTELVEYPKSRYDDQIDALEMCLSLIKKRVSTGAWVNPNFSL